MDANAVRIAAVNTLVELKEQGSDLTAKEWVRNVIPILAQPEDLRADAVWNLMQIPAMIDAHRDTDALYRLGGAHTVLWLICALTPTRIEEINRNAIAEAQTARTQELH